MANLASFWAGKISALEAACLGSFVDAGHDVVLYSFDELSVPAGVCLASASEILDQRYLSRFITGGKQNIAHFADYFRLNVFMKTRATWIDCDMIHLRNFDFDGQGNIVVSDDVGGIINSILKIGDETLLKDCLRRVEAIMDKDVPWAATQNVIWRALKKGGFDIKLKPARQFVPIHWDNFDMLLLPEHYDECVDLCNEAVTVHAYNNILDRIGFYKDVLPPKGSFLHSIFIDNAEKFGFTGAYPPSVVRALVQGWRAQFTGEYIGVGSILRQAIPSIGRSVRQRLWR